jgi:GT2 family glycosyltransferase
MLNPDIAFVINSFNRASLLKECLEVLSEWVEKSAVKERYVVVVYDAGSTDGSIEWLQTGIGSLSLKIEVLIAKPGDDTSFAAGVNAGVAHAKSVFPSLKYILLYETDNQILEEKPVLQAVKQLEDNEWLGACGFTVRKHDGKPAGVGTPFPTLINFALGKQLVSKFQLEAIPYKWQTTADGVEFSEVDIVYTSPLVIKLTAWDESKGLDSQMFPFSDCDLDWAKRMRDLGWRMGVIRSDAVIHDNKQALSAWSRTRSKQYHRGRLRYFLRHRPKSIYFVFPAVLMLRHTIELAIAKVAVKNPERKQQLTAQFLDLLKSSPKRYE